MRAAAGLALVSTAVAIGAGAIAYVAAAQAVLLWYLVGACAWDRWKCRS